MRDLIVDEEEQGVLGSQLNALADEKIELAHGEVAWHQILLLVKVSDSRCGRLLHDDLEIAKRDRES